MNQESLQAIARRPGGPTRSSASRAGGGSLAGKTVLVVEDEALLALAAVDLLDSFGMKPLGPALDVSQALAVLKAGPAPALALLDLELGTRTSEPVAAELRRLGVPFVVASANPLAGLVLGAPSLDKPYLGEDLRLALTAALRQRAGATRPCRSPSVQA